MPAVTEQGQPTGRRRGRYPRAFRRDVAALVIDENRKNADVAMEPITHTVRRAFAPGIGRRRQGGSQP